MPCHATALYPTSLGLETWKSWVRSASTRYLAIAFGTHRRLCTCPLPPNVIIADFTSPFNLLMKANHLISSVWISLLLLTWFTIISYCLDFTLVMASLPLRSSNLTYLVVHSVTSVSSPIASSHRFVQHLCHSGFCIGAHPFFPLYLINRQSCF